MSLIENTLTLSTAHLRESTCKWLDEQIEQMSRFSGDERHQLYLTEPLHIRFTGHAYGYIFFLSADTPLDEESFKSVNLPELYPILAQARALGCPYVNFDRDVAEDDQFPTFDW
jgi:hypothetical protein